MKPVNQRTNNLFKAFQIAGRGRFCPLPDDQWQHDVMRRIRLLKSSASAGSWSYMVEQVTWRLSPVMLTMIFICGIAWMNLEVIPDWQVFQLITNGVEEINLFENFI
jgi:hypothetical protein